MTFLFGTVIMRIFFCIRLRNRGISRLFLYFLKSPVISANPTVYPYRLRLPETVLLGHRLMSGDSYDRKIF